MVYPGLQVLNKHCRKYAVFRRNDKNLNIEDSWFDYEISVLFQTFYKLDRFGFYFANGKILLKLRYIIWVCFLFYDIRNQLQYESILIDQIPFVKARFVRWDFIETKYNFIENIGVFAN